MAERSIGRLDQDETSVFKSGEIRVVDFQGVVGAFGGSRDIPESREFQDIEEMDVEQLSEELEEGVRQSSREGIEQEIDAFLDEAERAGKSNPVLYVPDQYYDNLPESSGSKVDVGAIDGTIPVKILPIERDMAHMLNRFDFGEGMKQVLEYESETAVLVNPAGDFTYHGSGYVEGGEDVAASAYEMAIREQVDEGIEYLEGQRGVAVKDMRDNGVLEVQVDESSIGGRDFEYDVSDGELALSLGDDTVRISHDGQVYEGAVGREQEALDPRMDPDAQVYKFVIEE